LQQIIKDKERAQEANQRIQDLNESFAKETEKKLQDRMEAMQEKKSMQINTLMERLRLHVSMVKTRRYVLSEVSPAVCELG